MKPQVIDRSRHKIVWQHHMEYTSTQDESPGFDSLVFTISEPCFGSLYTT